ncbi:MAG: hypothetical protein WA294_17655 [Acidobacteriaceae bacterium]
MVGNRVAEDAVEPGDGAFRLAELGAAFKGFQVGGLEDVFGGGGIIDSSAQELQEAAALLGEVRRGFADCGRAAGLAEGDGSAARVAAPWFPLSSLRGMARFTAGAAGAARQRASAFLVAAGGDLDGGVLVHG